MPETPISLLDRLWRRQDPQDWQRLVDLYTPLVRQWLRTQSLQPADADDLVQEVMAVVVRELPRFRHDLRRGAFRRWLRLIMINHLRIFWRTKRPRTLPASPDSGNDLLAQLEDPDSRPSQLWDQEHDQHVARRLLELIEPEFEPTTWQAFRLLVLEEKSTADVAAELGISVNAARIAKSRVLSRFRQEIEGLIE
jgi:RNA polymerase sigma factor (sigma-70 family)